MRCFGAWYGEFLLGGGCRYLRRVDDASVGARAAATACVRDPSIQV